MKKVNTIVAVLIMLAISFNLISLRVLSQTAVDTYTITLTNKTGKTVLNNPTSALNIKVTPGGQGVSGLDTGVSLKATGAIPILSNVDSTTNVITIVWSGGISDGKAIIVGKLKQGSTVTPDFTVTKVEKDGGTDITNDLNITVDLSSSTASITSSSSSSGGISSSSSSSGSSTSEPSISLSGPEEFFVKKGGLNTFKLKVKGTNFTAATKCTIDISDDSLLRVKPRRFVLTPARKGGTLLARVSPLEVKQILENDESDIVTVDVSCSNDASDSTDIIISPPSAQ